MALNYNYFRDYDPVTGRYVQSDPIGLGDGINTYMYGLNNPVLLVDPFGLYTPFELTNIIFNETDSLGGPGVGTARTAVGQIAINRERPGVIDRGIAPSTLSDRVQKALVDGVPSVVEAYESSRDAAADAMCTIDGTGGARGFVLKGNPERVDRYGRFPVIQQLGPFINSFPTTGNPNVDPRQQHPRNDWINTFEQ